MIAGCVSHANAVISPGTMGSGHWVPFYSRNFLEGRRLDYFYDSSRVHRGSGHVVARWKVVSVPYEGATLYVIDIACREATFTEKGTELIDAQGRAHPLPQSELSVDRPIADGTSSDVFRRTFCR